MPDPISVGGLVALALSAATEAVVKGAAEQATKDAYNALKQRLSRLSADDVTALEKSPGSVGRQVILAELVDAQAKEDQEKLRALAQALANAMNRRSGDGSFIKWSAEFARKEPRRFVISFSRDNNIHRLEFSPIFGKISDPIELDGHQITKIWTQGRKTVNFSLDGSQFQLRFHMSRLTGRLSDIEFWVNNELTLNSP